MHTFWLILVSIVWGSTFFIIKETVDSVNEHLIVFFRGFSAFIAMFIYQIIVKPKSLINKNGIIYGLILGALLAATYISQTIGLKFTTTGHSAFITSSAVIAVPFILFAFYNFKLYAIDIIAVLIVMVGLFLLTYDLNAPFNKGDIITTITAITCAFHIVLAGRFVNKKNTDSLTIISYQFLGTSLVSFLAWVFTSDHSLQMEPNTMWSLLYLGLFGTLFCYFISVWVQKYVSSLKVAIVFSLEPVFAAIFGYFALHEVLSFRELMGAGLILLGVVVHSVLKGRSKAQVAN